MPEISVIIPCYNAAEYINEAVDSLLSQMCEGDELIVVDDGSTDDSKDRLAGYIREGRLQYIFQENSGVSAARNRGAEIACKDYLYFMDADDVALDGGLQHLREAADSHDDCAMVFGGHVSIVEGKQKKVHRQKSIGSNRESNFIDYVIKKQFSIANGGAVLIRRLVALEYPYPVLLSVSEDFCVYAWVLANHPCFSFPDPVIGVRKHPSSLRGQLELYEDAVQRLPDVLFDGHKLPPPLLKFKGTLQCNRLLSLFRAQYLFGEYDKSRQTYRDAIQCRPLNILKLSYLRKYIRTLLY